jgi:hypothetical protein
MALSFFQSMKANDNALGDSKFPVEAIFRFSSAPNRLPAGRSGPIGECDQSVNSRRQQGDRGPLLPAGGSELHHHLGMHAGEGFVSRGPGGKGVRQGTRRTYRYVRPRLAMWEAKSSRRGCQAVLAIARTEYDDKKLIFQYYRRWRMALVVHAVPRKPVCGGKFPANRENLKIGPLLKKIQTERFELSVSWAINSLLIRAGNKFAVTGN